MLVRDVWGSMALQGGSMGFDMLDIVMQWNVFFLWGNLWVTSQYVDGLVSCGNWYDKVKWECNYKELGWWGDQYSSQTNDRNSSKSERYLRKLLCGWEMNVWVDASSLALSSVGAKQQCTGRWVLVVSNEWCPRQLGWARHWAEGHQPGLPMTDQSVSLLTD